MTHSIRLAVATGILLGIPRAASCQLQLQFVREVEFPGILFTSGGDDGFGIRGADADPMTGNIWVVGLGERSEDGEEVWGIEFEPSSGAIVSVLTEGVGELQLAQSLALSPTSGNLFVGWAQFRDEGDNSFGWFEASRAGERIDGADIVDKVYTGADFDIAGNRYFVALGGTIEKYSQGGDLTSIINVDSPGLNFISADFHPVSGNLFLARTDLKLFEINPVTGQSISHTELRPFVPRAQPGNGFPHWQVSAIAFDQTGRRLFIGGDSDSSNLQLFPSRRRS